MVDNEFKTAYLSPNFLRCEYLVDPLGIDVIKPRLSWILESKKNSQKQTAYQVLVASKRHNLNKNKGDLWDSGKVNSDRTIHIVYKGIPLKSRIYCYWKVRVWDEDDSPSNWSNTAIWSMGLLEPSDWKAKWIGAPSKRVLGIRKWFPKKYYPCPLLRRSFNIEGKVKRAIIYATALGEYELYINGTRVGNHIFAPEWTDYDKKVQYQTYDVTNLLKEGENVLGAILADGWFLGNIGPGIPPFRHHFYGANRRLLLQMTIEQSDGTLKEIITDSNWKILKDGPIRKADHFKGETYNCEKEREGWDKLEYDDSEWDTATIDTTVKKNLVSQMNEPIRIVKEIEPIAVSEPKPGIFIFDVGQNIAGRCKIRLSKSICEEGSTITLRHGEILKPNGTLYTKNLRRAKATDKIIKILFKGTKEREFQPHFTYHGFRYVEVKGLKRGVKPDPHIITACVLASDTKLTGAFESSDPTLNKLWNNIIWSQRDNMISVPTDCPQRDERMGWMGDALVFCQTSIFNMDMAAFYNKWIRDMRDAQSKKGRFTDMVPTPYRTKGIFKYLFLGAPGWADCAIHLPWDVYLNYNDKKLIEQHYKSAKKFIDYVHSKNPNLLWIKKRGMNYNDWLNGNKIKVKGYPKKGGKIPKDVFATAYFARSTEIVSNMAKVIGLDESKYYSNLAKKIRKKFLEKYVDEEGKIKGDAQACYALALYFNLLPEELQFRAIEKLLKVIKRYDGRISTGFHSTRALMLELTRWGHNEVAYQLILSRRFPSWFYMIDNDATTIWERWDGYVPKRGFQNKNMNSFNHYAFGSIGEWIYRVILGINLDENQPGFKHIIIKPMPGGNLTWAKGHYNSIRGKINVDWSLNNDKFNLKVSIPPNTTAKVYLPANNLETITENDKPVQDSDNIKVKRSENNSAILEINSGTYSFISSI